MADKYSRPLDQLGQGGYVNDLTLSALSRPPLSMRVYMGDRLMEDTQTKEASVLGSYFKSPVHGQKLPFGLTYDSAMYPVYREAMADMIASQQGFGGEPLFNPDPMLNRRNQEEYHRHIREENHLRNSVDNNPAAMYEMRRSVLQSILEIAAGGK